MRDPLEPDARAVAAGARSTRRVPRGRPFAVGRSVAVSADISVTPRAGRSSRRISSTVNTIDSAKRTSAITQAEPVSKRWKPRL